MRVYHHYLLKENIVLEARLKGVVLGLENSSCCISYYVLSLSRALPVSDLFSINISLRTAFHVVALIPLWPDLLALVDAKLTSV